MSKKKRQSNNCLFSVERYLFSDFQGFDNCAIPLNILFLEIIQQFSPLTYKFEESPLGTVVFFVGQQVLRKVIDPRGKDCDLAFG